MSDIDDRDRLIAANRRASGERPLFCPTCGMDVELRDGRLHCTQGHVFARLAELVTKEGGQAA